MRVPLSWITAADLLAPMDGDGQPVVVEKPTRRSSLRGRIVRRDGRRPMVDSPDDIAAMIAATE